MAKLDCASDGLNYFFSIASYCATGRRASLLTRSSEGGFGRASDFSSGLLYCCSSGSCFLFRGWNLSICSHIISSPIEAKEILLPLRAQHQSWEHISHERGVVVLNTSLALIIAEFIVHRDRSASDPEPVPHPAAAHWCTYRP